MKGGIFILVVLLAAVGASRSHGSAFPVDPEKECQKVWTAQGLSPTWDPQNPQKNFLYSIASQEKYDDFYKRLDRGECWKDWVVLVYMAADNDLSSYSYRDLWEMETVGSAKSVDYLVFHDGSRKDGLRYYHLARRPKMIDYRPLVEKFVADNELGDLEKKEQEEKFWQLEGSTLIQTPPVKSLPEGDSGSLATASDFVQWALTRYPSKHVMLIGWSHGEGFDAKELQAIRTRALRASDPAAATGRQGGFAFDFTSNSHIAINQLGRALKTTVAKLRDGHTIDIAGSDSCLNQQVEFGFEALGVADFVFGSSTIVQSKGFNYKTLFHEIARTEDLEPEPLAKMIPQIYGKSVNGNAASIFSSYNDPYATMATWNMSEMGALARSMEKLADHLLRWLKQPGDESSRLDRRDLLRDKLLEAVRFANVSYDLTNVMQILEVWARDEREAAVNDVDESFFNILRTLASDTAAKINLSVEENYIGEAYRKGLIQTSQGVAVWLPSTRQEYKEMLPKFKLSQFYQFEQKPGEISKWGQLVTYLWEKIQ